MWRAGVKGKIAQGVRSSRLRRTPNFGQAKSQLARLMTPAAMNLVRLLRWLANEPKTQRGHAAAAQLPIDALTELRRIRHQYLRAGKPVIGERFVKLEQAYGATGCL